METLNFTLVLRAGLKMAEFARMCGVQRSSPRYWIAGIVEPSEEVRPRIQAALTVIEQALADGHLPFPAGATRDRRHRTIEQLRQAMEQDTLAE